MDDQVKSALEARRAAAMERIAKATASVSDEDRARRAEREEIAALEAHADQIERDQLAAALADRVEMARASNPKSQFSGLMIRTFPDTFIVMRNGQAHAAWQAAIINAGRTETQNRAPVDRSPINMKYALACVFDWNGEQNFGADKDGTENADRLRKYLIQNPGIVTPITDAAAELAGVFADERSKSA
jgi:hypothetical protein